jgi:hypothetical protein
MEDQLAALRLAFHPVGLAHRDRQRQHDDRECDDRNPRQPAHTCGLMMFHDDDTTRSSPTDRRAAAVATSEREYRLQLADRRSHQVFPSGGVHEHDQLGVVVAGIRRRITVAAAKWRHAETGDLNGNDRSVLDHQR